MLNPKLFCNFAGKYRLIVVTRLSPLSSASEANIVRVQKEEGGVSGSCGCLNGFSSASLSGGADTIFVLKQYSINVVGNIWEPRKLSMIYKSKDKIDAYAIA